MSELKVLAEARRALPAEIVSRVCVLREALVGEFPQASTGCPLARLRRLLRPFRFDVHDMNGRTFAHGSVQGFGVNKGARFVQQKSAMESREHGKRGAVLVRDRGRFGYQDSRMFNQSDANIREGYSDVSIASPPIWRIVTADVYRLRLNEGDEACNELARIPGHDCERHANGGQRLPQFRERREQEPVPPGRRRFAVRQDRVEHEQGTRIAFEHRCGQRRVVVDPKVTAKPNNGAGHYSPWTAASHSARCAIALGMREKIGPWAGETEYQ